MSWCRPGRSAGRRRPLAPAPHTPSAAGAGEDVPEDRRGGRWSEEKARRVSRVQRAIIYDRRAFHFHMAALRLSFDENFRVSGRKAAALSAKPPRSRWASSSAASPLYGFHLAICWVVGSLLGLNRLKMYFAANISNPFVAPWLVFAEVQLGAWLRRGSFHPLSRDNRVDRATSSASTRWSGAFLSARCSPSSPRGAPIAGARLGRGSPVRRARPAGLGSLCRHQHHRLGVRARQAADGSDLSLDTLARPCCPRAARSSISAAARDSRWRCSPKRVGGGPRCVALALAGAADLRPHDRRRAAQKRRRWRATALEGDAEIVAADIRTVPVAPARAVLLSTCCNCCRRHQDSLHRAPARAARPRGVRSSSARPTRPPAGASPRSASATA